ncbi:unnamed protein product [Prorocentrum cordatum]|uniref:Uncharacterized protein n=1 Tax=Prorocentrum cordatum TaxID=2364126 RepID=A0ABN9T9W7_9DINO|nr:unnamed protein product [Polarella glacialis]
MSWGRLQHVDITGCMAAGVLGQELVDMLPYHKGCCLEAANTGLADEHVVRLRNLAGQTEQARARVVEAERQCQAACNEYLAMQDALEDLANEQCEQQVPPAPPLPLHHPKRWRKGVDTPARNEYASFRSANVSGLKREDDGSWSMLGRSGASIALSTDEFAALDEQRRNMLAGEGYEEGEREDEESADARPGGSAGCQALLSEVQSFQNLVGFMVWNGAKALADDVQAARRKREEWESLWAKRIELQRKLGHASKSVYDASDRPARVASGQLIAHFTHLCLGGALTGDDVVEPSQAFWFKAHQRNAPPSAMARTGLAHCSCFWTGCYRCSCWERVWQGQHAARTEKL